MTQRKATRAIVGALALLALPGCLVSSLHPVYDPKSLVYDEALLGRWENKETETTILVSPAEWRSYEVELTDRSGTTRYHAHLTTIGAARVVNVIPHGGLEGPPLMVATNGFVQVDAQDNTLRLRELAYDAVFDRLRRGTLGVQAAIDVKDNVVITVSSTRLRAWLAGTLKNEALWAEWKTFTRMAR